jgi:hypothetical protein
VEITMTQTVATALRSSAPARALSPSTQPADWYTRPVLTDMRHRSAVASLNANYNSITRTALIAGVPTAPAGGVGFGAAKQGAPPRGVPR